jgi:translocation and assembly module TamA
MTVAMRGLKFGVCALAWWAWLGLSGCALLNNKNGDEPAAAPTLPPPIELQVEAPRELKALLDEHLDLARLRTVAPTEEVSDVELRRLEAAAPMQVRALLETEGYFAPQVTMTREAGSPPVVRIVVVPGPRTQVESVRLDWQGALATAQDADARALRAAVENAWPLPAGAGFRNPLWSAGKTGALARTRAGGYAAAGLQDSAAKIDAAAHKAQLALTVDSGPLFKVGQLDIRGLDRQPEETVRNLADFSPGVPATETLLLDFQERLQRTGLYERASVTLDTDPANAEAATVSVRLREMALQQATLGAGISANTGARVSLEHLHRLPFGWRATWRNKFELGQKRQAWEGELASQALPGLYRNLAGYGYERIESEVDTVSSARLRIGRSQDKTRIERLGFVQIETASVRTDTSEERAQALSLNLHGIWRDVDNIVLPTDGRSFALQTAVGLARSSGAPDGPFGRLYARAYWWKPFGRDWYAQARIEAGQVFTRSGVRVPDTQLFRAGGDDSVRGYGFRTLGPEVNGEAVSGKVLLTASAEVARPVSERYPSLWWAAFVDAGNAAERWSDYKPALGVGVGLRWRSPVGPLRLDLAYGEQVEKFRLHLSVGIAF